MSTAEFVDADTWAAARAELLDAEKRLTAERDALAARRRAMPWREITADYSVRRSRWTGHASPTCSARPTNSS